MPQSAQECPSKIIDIRSRAASARTMLERIPISQMPPEARQVFSEIKNKTRTWLGYGIQELIYSGSGDAYYWRGKNGDHWLLEHRSQSGKLEDLRMTGRYASAPAAVSPPKRSYRRWRSIRYCLILVVPSLSSSYIILELGNIDCRSALRFPS
jgi:hypothetical protein